MENKTDYDFKIKLKYDTPTHEAGAIISISEFKNSYPTLINKDNSDIYIRNILKGHIKDDLVIKSWFEIVEETLKFKLDDWVWHEEQKKAFKVVNWYSELKPNEATIGAVNTNPNTYKRYATDEEIAHYKLYSYCGGMALIGKNGSYYYNGVWKELTNVVYNIKQYIDTVKRLTTISLGYGNATENDYRITLNGLTIGCQTFSHFDIMNIAKILNIIEK